MIMLIIIIASIIFHISRYHNTLYSDVYIFYSMFCGTEHCAGNMSRPGGAGEVA